MVIGETIENRLKNQFHGSLYMDVWDLLTDNVNGTVWTLVDVFLWDSVHNSINVRIWS